MNRFPSIESFDKLIGTRRWLTENHGAPSEFTLRGKIKLHGINMGVGISPEGHIHVQSRELILEPSEKGPYEFLHSVGQHVLNNIGRPDEHITIFGEYAGTGVQKKDAITFIGKKAFFPFLIAYHDEEADALYKAWASGKLSSEEGQAAINQARQRTRVVNGPEFIETLLGGQDDVHVLPWLTEPITFDSADISSVEERINSINLLVSEIGEEDPYVKSVFGVSGVGEGIVFVPEIEQPGELNMRDFSNLTFKAKTEAHRVKKSAKAASVETEMPQDAKDFVEQFVTENRMEQMLNERLDGVMDKSKTTQLIGAVLTDVMKESKQEFQALDLDQKGAKALQRVMGRKIAQWYVNKCENDWRIEP